MSNGKKYLYTVGVLLQRRLLLNIYGITVITGHGGQEIMQRCFQIMHNLGIEWTYNHQGNKRTNATYELNGRPACSVLAGHLSKPSVIASIQFFRNNDINRNKS